MSNAAAVRLVSEMPREAVDTVQISVRVPQKTVDDLDELAAAISPPGVTLTRADALRAVITRGLEELTRETAPKPRKR